MPHTKYNKEEKDKRVMKNKRECELLIQNRDIIKKLYRFEGGLLHITAASIYATKGKLMDSERIEHCKHLIKAKTGIFSNFRGFAELPLVCQISLSSDPEATLERGLGVYKLLKQEFWGSSYLPMVAMIIAQMTTPDRYSDIVSRTRRIYNRMKQEHPFLTSSEDSAYCALMALSDRSDDELITDMEACYKLLKGNFFSGNAVQSLTHVLALCEGSPEEKAKRTMELFGQLKNAGKKYGTQYELATLGMLAMSCDSIPELVNEIVDIDNWLSAQKGFGLFGSVTKKQRLMYSGMLAMPQDFDEQTMQTAAVGATLAVLIAQQVAMCACIAATSASASAGAN